MNMNPEIKLYPSVRPKRLEETPPTRANLTRIVFAEEKSPSLMAHTLAIVTATYNAAKIKKEQFEAFNYEPELTRELVETCLRFDSTWEELSDKLESVGLLSAKTVSNLSDESAGDLATQVNEVMESAKRQEEIIAVLTRFARTEIGEKPGYKAFMDWVYDLLGLIHGQKLSKEKWFDLKNESIDELAYDYVRYGLTPHEELQNLSPAFLNRFQASYRAAKMHHSSSSTKAHNPFIRKWISLRKSALTRGRSFDSQITPEILQVMAARPFCPVTGVELEIAPTDVQETADNRWSVERRCNDLGYSFANICVTSNRVNRIRGNLTCFDIFARAAGDVEDNRLTRIEWARLADLHFEVCRRVEPYFGSEPAPLLWNRLIAGVVNRVNICQDAIAQLVDKEVHPQGFQISQNWFRSQLKNVPWFSSFNAERLDMEIKRLYYVVRQQLKNKHPSELNFALLYDIKDGKIDQERVEFANTLVYFLGVNLFGEDISSGSKALRDLKVAKPSDTLATGHYSDKGYFKGH